MGFLIKFVKWINANPFIAIGLYITLPILSFYLHLYHNISPDTISLLLFVNFIIRIIASAIFTIYILSFRKAPEKIEKTAYQKEIKKKKKERKEKLTTYWASQFLLGLIIIINPLIISQNVAATYKTDKLVNESEITNGEIIELQYWNGHMTSAGYIYEFNVNEEKYTGRKTITNGEIGQIIEIVYFTKNPWINKKHDE